MSRPYKLVLHQKCLFKSFSHLPCKGFLFQLNLTSLITCYLFKYQSSRIKIRLKIFLQSLFNKVKFLKTLLTSEFRKLLAEKVEY